MKSKVYYDEIEKKWYRICHTCKRKSFHKNKRSCQVSCKITPSCAKCQPLISKCSICGEHGHNKSFHNPPPTEKICKLCKKLLPIQEFFHQKKENAEKMYYGTNCKKCDGVRLQNRYDQSIEMRISYLHRSSKRRAKEKNIPFNITQNQMIEQYYRQNGLCYFTYEPLILKQRGKMAISVDKVIPENGYINGNVVFCLFRINEMKSNIKYEEFIEFCKKIYENRR